MSIGCDEKSQYFHRLNSIDSGVTNIHLKD